MVKSEAVHIRFDPEEKAAFERLAAADERSLSAFIRKIAVGWLRENGHLGKEKL